MTIIVIFAISFSICVLVLLNMRMDRIYRKIEHLENTTLRRPRSNGDDDYDWASFRDLFVRMGDVEKYSNMVCNLTKLREEDFFASKCKDCVKTEKGGPLVCYELCRSFRKHMGKNISHDAVYIHDFTPKTKTKR